MGECEQFPRGIPCQRAAFSHTPGSKYADLYRRDLRARAPHYARAKKHISCWVQLQSTPNTLWEGATAKGNYQQAEERKKKNEEGHFFPLYFSLSCVRGREKGRGFKESAPIPSCIKIFE
jgi:hypothetical protein